MREGILGLHVFVLFLFLPLLHTRTDIVSDLVARPQSSVKLADSSLMLRFLRRSNVPVSSGGGIGLLGDKQRGFVSLFRTVHRTGRRIRLRCFGFQGSSVTGTLFTLLTRGMGRNIRIQTVFSTFNG